MTEQGGAEGTWKPSAGGRMTAYFLLDNGGPSSRKRFRASAVEGEKKKPNLVWNDS